MKLPTLPVGWTLVKRKGRCSSGFYRRGGVLVQQGGLEDPQGVLGPTGHIMTTTALFRLKVCLGSRTALRAAFVP